MGASRTQILLLIETKVESAVSHTSCSEGSSELLRRYALLPSRARSPVSRKILAENDIEVLHSSHMSNLRNVKLEIVEVFLDSEQNGQQNCQYLYVDHVNLNLVQQLFNKSEVCYSRESSTVVRYVLDEEENLQLIEKMLVIGSDIIFGRLSRGTLLHFAASSTHFYEQLMKLALRYGANINARRRDDGITPLHLAVKNNCAGSARLLLENGALIGPKMADGSTPLHVAAREDRLEIARLLLDSGANPNVLIGNGSTPCRVATEAGLSEMVKLLAERGANADTKKSFIFMPLYQVVEVGSLELVRRLVQAGADVNAESEHYKTALHMATQLGGEGHSIAVYLVRNGADVNALDNKGATPLYYCLRDFTLVQFLVEHGADINVETISGRTVLLKAIKSGMLDTCKYLLDLNPDFRVKGNRLAFKVAFLRVEPEYRDVVDRMIQQGFSADAKDANDPDLLFEAILKNRREIVEQLLTLGANVDQHHKFRKGMVTPLHLAIKNNHEDIVRLLLDQGANFSVICDPNDCNSTPIPYAAKNASLNILKMLVAKNIKVQEEPCLILSAAKNADSEVILYLLEESLDPNIKNEKGETPMSIAVRRGNINAINVLVKIGAQVSLMDLNGTMKNDPIRLAAFLDYCFEYLILSGGTVSKLHGDFFPSYSWRTSYFRDIAEVFARHLLKMEMANKLACAKDVLPSDLYEQLELDRFKKQCELETETMALEKVGNTDVTFYDVLGKSLAQIAGLTRNPNFVEMFKICDVKNKFPIYGSILETKFRLGSLRVNLLKSGIKVLSNFSRLFFALPDVLKEIILDYLSNQDLFILQKGLPKE